MKIALSTMLVSIGLCLPSLGSAQAVVASAPQMLVVQKASVGSSLPSNTEVWVSMNAGMTSKHSKVGDRFDVTVCRDVMMGDYVVIPRGTPGHGQIAYRTGKGAFGKSAKIEFDLVDVKVGERYIPISGHYRLEGNGNTGAMVATAVAVGVFSAFVTGHSATAPQGSEWKAYTKEPIMLAIALRPFGRPEDASQVAGFPSVPSRRGMQPSQSGMLDVARERAAYREGQAIARAQLAAAASQ